MATSTEKNNAKTGIRIVPSPKPEKRVSPDAIKAAIEMIRYCIALVPLVSRMRLFYKGKRSARMQRIICGHFLSPVVMYAEGESYFWPSNQSSIFSRDKQESWKKAILVQSLYQLKQCIN